MSKHYSLSRLNVLSLFFIISTTFVPLISGWMVGMHEKCSFLSCFTAISIGILYWESIKISAYFILSTTNAIKFKCVECKYVIISTMYGQQIFYHYRRGALVLLLSLARGSANRFQIIVNT